MEEAGTVDPPEDSPLLPDLVNKPCEVETRSQLVATSDYEPRDYQMDGILMLFRFRVRMMIFRSGRRGNKILAAVLKYVNTFRILPRLYDIYRVIILQTRYLAFKETIIWN